VGGTRTPLPDAAVLVAGISGLDVARKEFHCAAQEIARLIEKDARGQLASGYAIQKALDHFDIAFRFLIEGIPEQYKNQYIWRLNSACD